MPPPGATQRADSKFIIFENFKKLNTAEVRQGLSEAELAWVENLQPIADNNWKTMPGPSSSSGSITGTFTAFFYGVINGVDYLVGFTATGGAWAFSVNGLVQFANDGTFSFPGQVISGFTSPGPDMTSWENVRFLFNDPIAGYCTWDGTSFTRQGGVSPNIAITNPGAGYTSAPAVTITGGSGTGATAVATISTPQVAQVILDNAGSGYSTAPTVQFSGGGGSGAAATATVDTRSIITLTPHNAGTYSIILIGQPVSIAVSFSGGSPTIPATAPTLTIANGGLGLNAVGQYFVQRVTLSNAGAGYSSAPTVVFTPNNLTTGTPANYTCTVGAGQVLGNPVVTNPGSGYTSTPTVAFVGGSPATTATGHAILQGGGVATITLTNPGTGYLPSDVLTVTIGAPPGPIPPAVQATASAHVAPFIPKGTSVAVFQGRVWLNFFTGPNSTGPLTGLQWSGVNGFDDWNVANASGALILPDADLIHQITGLRSFNNFLWIIGDQSIKQIGNIALNNAGNVTLFTILTLSSDQGTTYLRSCVSFNRVFFFVNQNGVYAVFGSSVQKVSGDLDGIFQNTVFFPAGGGLVPQASLVDIFNVHCVMWLLKYTDNLFTNTTRSLFVIFDGKRWFTASQGDGINVVTGTVTVASPNWVPYVSSGGDITGTFNQINTSVNVRLKTALSHHGNPVQRKKTIRLGHAVTNAFTVQPITFTIDSNEASQSYTPSPATGFRTRTLTNDPATGNPVNVSGTYLGFTLSGLLQGFTLTNLRIEYQETNIGNQS